MNDEQIIKLIHNNPRLMDFVTNQIGTIDFVVCGVPVKIYKEYVGADYYYYKIPYDHTYDYSSVVCFMNIAIPELSRLIEEERTKKLINR